MKKMEDSSELISMLIQESEIPMPISFGNQWLLDKTLSPQLLKLLIPSYPLMRLLEIQNLKLHHKWKEVQIEDHQVWEDYLKTLEWENEGIGIFC